MKILVPVKRVVDHKVNIRVAADGSGVETSNVKMSMNPFDEIAVEEAVRLKEAGTASEIVVVSIGVKQAEDTLRTALALGADKAILVLTQDAVEPLGVAKILHKLVQEESPDLVLMGKQAIDDDASQTGQMLAALLDWASANYAAKIEIDGANLTVTEESDQGRDVFSLSLPAIVTVDLQLNQPRNVSLPNVIKAKKKPLETKELSAFGLDVAPRIKNMSTRAPDARNAGQKVNSVDELVAAIKAHPQLQEIAGE